MVNRGKLSYELLAIIFTMTFFSFCSKTSTTSNNPQTLPIVTTPIVTTPIPLAKIVYSGKTSYALKTPQTVVDIDPIRKNLGIRNIGVYNGNNNLGFVYVDMNNDGLEDIFYPYSSDGNIITKSNVLINKGNGVYALDSSMFPSNFLGTTTTRKTVVGDFNNDSLPDIFMCNSGYEALTPGAGIGVGTWYLENCSMLLSNKNGAYTYKEFTELGKAFWHGAASGDLNGDGNMDIIAVGGGVPKALYGDGKGGFTISDINTTINKGNGYITVELVDVDKDGQCDVILSGDEGAPLPAYYSKSMILWNKKGNFSNSTIICEANTNGWRYIMNIGCEDLDGDGINEIILCRTGDNSAVWYGGYQLNVYKQSSGFISFTDVTSTYFGSDNILRTTNTGKWMYQMIMKKEVDGLFSIYGYIGNSEQYLQWKQNSSKLFIKIR
jgi:hypothetical protein